MINIGFTLKIIKSRPIKKKTVIRKTEDNVISITYANLTIN